MNPINLGIIGGTGCERTDPYIRSSETSRQAAKAIEPHLSKQEALVMMCLMSAYAFENNGLTDEQIQGWTGLEASSARPRRVALCEKGKIKDSGERRNTRSGRPAVIWIATKEQA